MVSKLVGDSFACRLVLATLTVNNNTHFFLSFFFPFFFCFTPTSKGQIYRLYTIDKTDTRRYMGQPHITSQRQMDRTTNIENCDGEDHTWDGIVLKCWMQDLIPGYYMYIYIFTDFFKSMKCYIFRNKMLNEGFDTRVHVIYKKLL